MFPSAITVHKQAPHHNTPTLSEFASSWQWDANPKRCSGTPEFLAEEGGHPVVDLRPTRARWLWHFCWVWSTIPWPACRCSSSASSTGRPIGTPCSERHSGWWPKRPSCGWPACSSGWQAKCVCCSKRNAAASTCRRRPCECRSDAYGGRWTRPRGWRINRCTGRGRCG